jgi:hypothetical protein
VTSFAINGTNAGNSELYSVSTTTGAATAIGAAGNRLETLVAADGVLYGFLGTSADGDQLCVGCPEGLVIVNTSTGAVTPTGIALTQPDGWGGAQVQAAVAELNSTSATPEPGTFSLLLTGGLLMAHARRFRRPLSFTPTPRLMVDSTRSPERG